MKHETGAVTHDEYLTPPYILKALGKFDLDPCAPIVRPWPTAADHYTKEDDGLFLPWNGRIWCNPPYGRALYRWLEKLALHGNGIALTFNRSDVPAFQQYALRHADSWLLLRGRIVFYDVQGNQLQDKRGYKGYAGAPSVLLAYGEANSQVLAECGLKGVHLPIKRKI